MCCTSVYAPGAGSNTGAAAGGRMRYVPLVMLLSLRSSAQAMARSVVSVATSYRS